MSALPPGRLPQVGISELVAALHRRRERRREAAGELGAALAQLRGAVDHHLERIAQVRAAVEAQGGDVAHLKVYDDAMTGLRAQLAAAEREMANACAQGLA